jgi:3-dehydroquinate synthase
MLAISMTKEIGQEELLYCPSESSSTRLVFGAGVLSRSAAYLNAYRDVRLLLVSDSNVAPIYARSVRDTLEQAGYDAHLLEIPAGEGSKTLDTLIGLYGRCSALRVERSDVVIAVGGGVVGDIGGMLAGTYLRGMEFIQIPTSLVSMVTASVGGKAGLNFGGVKNLIGLFKHPSVVLADTNTLDTLPEIEFRSGLGELVAVGVLGAPEIIEDLESSGVQLLPHLILTAVRCKSTIVKADPFERLGIRARLNLGHTFGHALEKLSGFTLPHGIAVGVGLCIACRLSVRLGLCEGEVSERVHSLLTDLNLPVAVTGYSAQELMAAMRGDKKRRGGHLQFVLPKAVGEVFLLSEDQIPPEILEEAFSFSTHDGNTIHLSRSGWNRES